ncbi:MAG: NYN domain-containing protein [Syntrophales bacterium]
MHVILDGYNVIRQSDTLRAFERRSLEEARTALARSVAAYQQKKGHQVTIVFDGWSGGSPLEERDRFGNVEIIYSRKGEKADEVIKRMVHRSSEETIVVTSDREVADYANRHGGSAVSSLDFERILIRSSSDSACRGAPEDTGDEEERPGKGKGPSRRPSKREKAYQSRFRKL